MVQQKNSPHLQETARQILWSGANGAKKGGSTGDHELESRGYLSYPLPGANVCGRGQTALLPLVLRCSVAEKVHGSLHPPWVLPGDLIKDTVGTITIQRMPSVAESEVRFTCALLLRLFQ